MRKLWNTKAARAAALMLAGGVWTVSTAHVRLYAQEDESQQSERAEKRNESEQDDHKSDRGQENREESNRRDDNRREENTADERREDTNREEDSNRRGSRERDQGREERESGDRDQSANRAQLGIYVQQSEDGVEIVDMDRNSPAVRAGIQSGDILESIDGRVIDEARQVSQIVSRMREGDRVNLVVWRDGERVRTNVVLAASQEGQRIRGRQPQQAQQANQGNMGWLGVALNDKKTDEEGEKKEGAEITLVYPTSPAAVAGLRDGDRIVAADDKKFESAESFTQYIKEKKPGDEVELAIASEDEEEPQKVKVTLASRTDYFDDGERSETQNDNPLYQLPEYMMRMEHDRRMAECQKRMEDLLLQTLREVRDLKAEVAELKAASGETTRK